MESSGEVFRPTYGLSVAYTGDYLFDDVSDAVLEVDPEATILAFELNEGTYFIVNGNVPTRIAALDAVEECSVVPFPVLMVYMHNTNVKWIKPFGRNVDPLSKTAQLISQWNEPFIRVSPRLPKIKMGKEAGGVDLLNSRRRNATPFK